MLGPCRRLWRVGEAVFRDLLIIGDVDAIRAIRSEDRLSFSDRSKAYKESISERENLFL